MVNPAAGTVSVVAPVMEIINLWDGLFWEDSPESRRIYSRPKHRRRRIRQQWHRNLYRYLKRLKDFVFGPPKEEDDPDIPFPIPRPRRSMVEGCGSSHGMDDEEDSYISAAAHLCHSPWMCVVESCGLKVSRVRSTEHPEGERLRRTVDLDFDIYTPSARIDPRLSFWLLLGLGVRPTSLLALGRATSISIPVDYYYELTAINLTKQGKILWIDMSRSRWDFSLEEALISAQFMSSNTEGPHCHLGCPLGFHEQDGWCRDELTINTPDLFTYRLRGNCLHSSVLPDHLSLDRLGKLQLVDKRMVCSTLRDRRNDGTFHDDIYNPPYDCSVMFGRNENQGREFHSPNVRIAEALRWALYAMDWWPEQPLNRDSRLNAPGTFVNARVLSLFVLHRSRSKGVLQRTIRSVFNASDGDFVLKMIDEGLADSKDVLAICNYYDQLEALSTELRAVWTARHCLTNGHFLSMLWKPEQWEAKSEGGSTHARGQSYIAMHEPDAIQGNSISMRRNAACVVWAKLQLQGKSGPLADFLLWKWRKRPSQIRCDLTDPNDETAIWANVMIALQSWYDLLALQPRQAADDEASRINIPLNDLWEPHPLVLESHLELCKEVAYFHKRLTTEFERLGGLYTARFRPPSAVEQEINSRVLVTRRDESLSVDEFHTLARDLLPMVDEGIKVLHNGLFMAPDDNFDEIMCKFAHMFEEVRVV
jgi:hypothetical protein